MRFAAAKAACCAFCHFDSRRTVIWNAKYWEWAPFCVCLSSNICSDCTPIFYSALCARPTTHLLSVLEKQIAWDAHCYFCNANWLNFCNRSHRAHRAVGSLRRAVLVSLSFAFFLNLLCVRLSKDILSLSQSIYIHTCKCLYLLCIFPTIDTKPQLFNLEGCFILQSIISHLHRVCHK